jgi:hypothetical protein
MAARAEPIEHWTLDKRVPLALIAVLLAQFAGAVWMIADLKSDVGELQRADIRFIETVRENRVRIDTVDRERNSADMRLIRVEEQSKQIYEAVRDLATAVRRSLERPDTPAAPNIIVPTLPRR